jgi:hypothetical protein
LRDRDEGEAVFGRPTKRNGENEHHDREPVQEGKSPSQLTDERIRELNDWRGGTLARNPTT